MYSFDSPSPTRKDHKPIKDSDKRSLHSKSKSLSPPYKEVYSTSISPRGVNPSSSQSPKPLQAIENLLVQESRQNLSRSLSRSPEMGIEKLTPTKGDFDKSPISKQE